MEQKKDKTPEYSQINKLISSLSDEALEYMYLRCWMELSERGLGRVVPIEEGE